MERFDKFQLTKQLEILPDWKRVIFMLLCCERMLPNYGRFSKETGFGDASVLRNALDVAWTWVESGDVPKDLEVLRKACEGQAPDTEGDFESDCTSAALDAACAAATVLDAIEVPSVSLALDVATFSFDTVYMFVSNMQDLDPVVRISEDAILADPIIQNELCCQQKDLLEFASRDDVRHVLVPQMRERARLYCAGSLGS